MSFFTPPCSNWTFIMLKQSQIETLTLSLNWRHLGYTPAERSHILSRLVVAAQASVRTLTVLDITHLLETLGFAAQLPLLDALNFISRRKWKAGSSDTTSIPIVLNMKTIFARAEMLFFMFSRPPPLTVPRLEKIFVAFYTKDKGMFNITATATSIARLRDSVGPNVDLLPTIEMDSGLRSMESLCNGNQPICPIWEQEFSKFPTLSLTGKMTILDSPDTFRIILELLRLFSGIEDLHIRLRPSPEVDPTPIHLKPWMVKAISNQSPNITFIYFNEVAQHISLPSQTL
ncbi:uncharacterized protein LACBIDRAFT_324286 [Laccaria bicolor S238N-H82]|uniref:Predicted protein n=1 Tax=Laccaria bicolor (strain S238N-H82 / ATCC MYA-4686) TaxID=486041 RepID=B0D1B9_LACBS|nr:uncharacterized protein LACBIDRAFT_324286 [Laccaria bicolor S238N-H82]EDR11606.1 predicted protein [Laccaria bicolor S238N-H82]|eukprot:XP_001877503.1 predicted protein [Laccaria bicolor S238N-H82]